MTGEAMRRVHLSLSAELFAEMDALVGKRGRSAFIREAVEEKLQRLRRIEAFERAVASPTVGVPEWETRESAYAWVRAMRGDSEGSSGSRE